MRNVRRAGDRGIDRLHVSELEAIADVVGAVLPDRRPALAQGLLGRDRHRQRLVLDLDKFGRIPCPGRRVGDHERHAVPDERDLPGLKRQSLRLENRRAVRPGERRSAVREAGQVAKAIHFDVRAGEDRGHARYRQRVRSVDAGDSCVRVR